MKNTFLLAFISLLIITFSCKKNEVIEDPIEIFPSGRYTGSTDEGGSIAFTIENDLIISFVAETYFNGFLEIVNIQTFKTMTQTENGFIAEGYFSDVLTGYFSNDTVNGYWMRNTGTQIVDSLAYTVIRRYE